MKAHDLKDYVSVAQSLIGPRAEQTLSLSKYDIEKNRFLRHLIFMTLKFTITLVPNDPRFFFFFFFFF